MKKRKKWYWWLGLLFVIVWVAMAIPMWLIKIPQAIMDDLVFGIPYAIGNIAVLVIGIVLMRKGKTISKADSGKSET